MRKKKGRKEGKSDGGRGLGGLEGLEGLGGREKRVEMAQSSGSQIRQTHTRRFLEEVFINLSFFFFSSFVFTQVRGGEGEGKVHLTSRPSGGALKSV